MPRSCSMASYITRAIWNWRSTTRTPTATQRSTSRPSPCSGGASVLASVASGTSGSDLVARADHTIDIEVIQGQWERMGQFYSSLATGHTTAFFSYLGPACRTLTERNYASWSHRHSCVCRNPGPGRDEKYLLSSGKRRVPSIAAYGSWISPCRPQVRCQDGAPSRPIAATLTGSFPPTPALDHQTVRHEGCRVCEV